MSNDKEKPNKTLDSEKHNRGVNIGDVEGGIHDSIIAGRDIIHKITNFFIGGRDEQRDLRNRRIMLERVRSFWVEGVLEKSLHKEILIQLGKQEQSDAVPHPWDMQVQETIDREPQPIPKDKPIIKIFEEMGRSLLILGAPGSGKTITLLELARDAIARALEDPTLPIPAVFNLSSWAEPKQSLKEWIIEELKLKYRIPKDIGKQWIESNDLLLLLDGLDEVKQESRNACVEAINQFRQEHGLTDIVVCSRAEEYKVLSKQLNLQGAILLQPLTREQIDDYLATTGSELNTLRSVMQENTALQELAESPLMLGIMVLAYQGLSAEEVNISGPLEEQHKRLFSLYTERMLKRRRIDERYTSQQTIRWLSWIAQKMSQHAQTEFFIEGLQPTWLPPSIQQLFFKNKPKIQLVEMIHWSLKDIALSIVFGVTTGFVIWAIGGIASIFKLGLDYGKNWMLKYGIFMGIYMGIFNGILALLLLIKAHIGVCETKKSPNQGIWQSGRNAVRMGFAAMIGVVLAAVPFYFFEGDWGLSTVFIIFGGTLLSGIAFFYFGGLVCVEHFVLRVILYLKGYLPWNLAHFLDYAVDRVFLRKVGGGYIFIHRTLLEYFASLHEEGMEPR